MKIFELLPIIIYGIVGIISLVMALKSLLSKRFISFHEDASGVSWESLDKRLQCVILALTRISGLGFLVVALILLVFPTVNYFRQDEFIRYSMPILSLIFCTGLFVVNYILQKQTQSKTPWVGALMSIFAIIAGMILSFSG